MPPPPGFVAGEGHGSNFMKAVEATDPTTITSIIKFWYEAEQRWGVEITWVGGVAPYSLVASTTPSFEWEVETRAKEISGPSFTDHLAGEIVDNLFYNVTDLSVISPAVEGRGYEPEPAPGPPITMTQFVWWGSTVIFTAGFLDPIAPANLSFFNRRAEKASDAADPDGSGYSPWVQFEVPWDARSTIPATIQSHSRMSPGGYYANMIPQTPDLVFTNIRGVVWAPEVGEAIPDVWVAADGVVAQVNLFTDDPSKVLRVTDIEKPYISRVSDSGMLAVVEGQSDPAPSEVYQVNATTESGGKTHFAFTKDSDFTRDIEPVGIALSPDGQTCYVADASTGSVVKIPAGAGPGTTTIEDSWGGMSGFVFANAAPIDVSVGGSVLVINDAHPYPLWELVDEDTANFTGLTYGQHTHVLQVDRDLSTETVWRVLVSAAPAAAEAFNRKPIDQFPAAYHGSIVYGGAGVLNLYPEDREGQVYTIWPRDPQRVIISNSGQSVPYTSSWQVADRVIGFEVTGWEGLEFHLELIDPPDTAAYAPDGGWDMGRPKQLPYEGNDNVEDLDSGNAGLALDPDATTWATSLNVTPVDGDIATVYLQVTDRYAGDNYQVQVMKCDPVNGCGADPFPGVLRERVVALSPIFTAWKRIYLERDKMFRRGGVLAENYLPDPQYECGAPENPMCDCVADPDADCCHGIGPILCNQIVAYEWQNAAAGDQVAVFDEFLTYETIPEFADVSAVSPGLEHGLVRLTFASGLELAHEASARIEPDPPEKYQPTFSNLKSAGYGVVSGCDLSSNQINGTNSCFYQADLQGAEQPFNDAFIEFLAPREGMSTMPFIGSTWFTSPPELGFTYFSGTWFENWDPDLDYFHLIGANRDIFFSLYGLTKPHYNWTYVFRNSIWLLGMSEGKSDLEIDNLTRDTTVHELAHQFKVNSCAGGHDTRDAWCQAVGYCGLGAVLPQTCVMVAGVVESGWDSVIRFCREDIFLGDPTCADPPPGEAREGAMRTVSDPP